MSRLKHTHADAPVSHIEVLRDAQGVLLVLDLSDAGKERVDQAMGAQRATLLSDATKDQTHTRIYRYPLGVNPDINALTNALGGGFVADKTQSKKAPQGLNDSNRWRGIFGTIGQILQQFAGYQEKNLVLNQSSAVSMASNLITVGYGTQTRVNDEKTDRLRHQVDLMLTREQPQYDVPSEDMLKAPVLKAGPATKLNRFVSANNMIISDGMKFASQVFLGARGNNWVDRTMGHLQWSSKVVTFVGLDKDDDTPEGKKSLVTRFRENTNIFSGIMEWAGQGFNMLNAVHLTQIHDADFAKVKKDFDVKGIASVKKHYRPLKDVFEWQRWKNFKFSDIRILSPMRFGSVILFATGFIIKSFAPFSSKDLDWGELQRHAQNALSQIAPEQRDAVLAKIATHYRHAIKDEGLSYAEIYQRLQPHLQTQLYIEAPKEAAPRQEAPLRGGHAAALMAERAQTPVALAMHT